MPKIDDSTQKLKTKQWFLDSQGYKGSELEACSLFLKKGDTHFREMRRVFWCQTKNFSVVYLKGLRKN